LTEREQRALLKVTGEHRAVYRDHCLYAMALGTGLRELIALDVGDVLNGIAAGIHLFPGLGACFTHSNSWPACAVPAHPVLAAILGPPVR